MTGSTRKNFLVLFGVLLATAAVCGAYLAATGFSDETLRVLLRLTARVSFMLFLVVFVARPLRQLVPADWTRRLLRERRSIGIAFAAVHTVHLALIAWRFSAFPELEYAVSGGVVGGLAYALIYLMLLTSFDGPARAIGPAAWRRLHKTGLYVVGFVFVATLLPEPGAPFLTFERAWFVVLTAGAIVIRLTAWLAKRRPKSATL